MRQLTTYNIKGLGRYEEVTAQVQSGTPTNALKTYLNYKKIPYKQLEKIEEHTLLEKISLGYTEEQIVDFRVEKEIRLTRRDVSRYKLGQRRR